MSDAIERAGNCQGYRDDALGVATFVTPPRWRGSDATDSWPESTAAFHGTRIARDLQADDPVRRVLGQQAFARRCSQFATPTSVGQ